MSQSTTNSAQIARATGLLVIEVTNSNPNGDPDRESDPRQRPDRTGEISPVSFKRKLRDLVEDKEGPVWLQLAAELNLDAAGTGILESRGRDRKAVEAELRDGTFIDKYWDGRVFGNTFLEEKGPDTIRTGAVQFALGLSVAPIEVERLTTTNKAGVQEGKTRGMAPMAFRIVRHGVYCMPFFINPTAARKSGCHGQDIALLLRLIPYAYAHTRSYIRPAVEIRHAWYVEHKSSLGSCPDFAIVKTLTPRKKDPRDKPSTSWDDYDCPDGLPKELEMKVATVRDLVTAL